MNKHFLYYFFKNTLIMMFNKRIFLDKTVKIKRNNVLRTSGDGSSIYISAGSVVSENCYISAVEGGTIILGNHVYFNRNAIIVSREKIKIGDNTIFGPNVMIYDHNHIFDHDHIYNEFRTSPIVIENDCWIGAGVILLKGCRVGAHSVIGAGVIVKGEIPPYSIIKRKSEYECEAITNG